jgi:hypothetical protein
LPPRSASGDQHRQSLPIRLAPLSGLSNDLGRTSATSRRRQLLHFSAVCSDRSEPFYRLAAVRVLFSLLNEKQRAVDWQFTIDKARVKLKRLYPKI